jgi:hypothetical protein
MGRPLLREDGSVIFSAVIPHTMLLLGLTNAVTVGSKSHSTKDRILLSHLGLDSLFVASYNSQGYGGGILTPSIRGGDYEERRLLGYKNQCVPHRKQITSPLLSPAG